MPAERKNSRKTVSDTVRSLLMDLVNDDPEVMKVGQTRLYNQKLREMAAYMGVSADYIPVKVKRQYWDLNDLDKLADFFDLDPSDFLAGYENIHHREKREHD